jgi:hypothetical protein
MSCGGRRSGCAEYWTRYSVRDTAEELNRKGFMTRAGQAWRFEYVRSAMRTLERQPNLLLAEL